MRGQLLRLQVGRSALRAEAVERGSLVWAGEVSYADVADLVDAIAQLAAEPPHACRRLVVTLERPPVQVRTLSGLPPVKRRYLVALVARQAGRFFRRNGQALVTDAAWVSVGATRVVRAAAVEEPLVEAIAQGARAAGLWLGAIAPADAGAVLSLLPPSERESRERTARRRTRWLAIAAGVVWLAVGVLFVGRLAWERRTVERELAALEKPVAVVLAARHELRDAETSLHAVTAAERGRGRALGALTAFAEALPDSSVLTSLAWSAEGTGVLVGAARRAADVAARLDRLTTLPGVRFGGPVVREPIAGREWERFSMLFGIEAGVKREGS